MTKQVSESEHKLFSLLAQKGNELTALSELTQAAGVDQAHASAWCQAGEAEGFLAVDVEEDIEFFAGKEIDLIQDGKLPERRVLEALIAAGGEAFLPELPQSTGLSQKAVGQSLKFLTAKNWASKQGKRLKVASGYSSTAPELGADETLVKCVIEEGHVFASSVADQIAVDEARKLLKGRSALIGEKTRKTRRVKLTPAGRQLVKSGISVLREVNQLTSDLLRSGEWRDVTLRPYDVRLDAKPTYPGKRHPLVRILQQTRRVFLQLGFTEVDSPYVESSFWDFDALFQPQDHPARDMQDTFYIQRPSRSRLPAEEIVQTVARTHEDGGETGSLGWRYRWERELAHKPLLRTHSTAGTIRALASDPKSPRKVFLVGPVFRRETIDYKHLPVFHQVDGIIIDEKATFATLLGTLQAFYRQMGFKRFQFRPAFFPYTEPSVEVFVWSEKKKDWVEMGGAGMFRPEVTEPFGCKVPVLAWGLGLERLAMFRYELSSISELYRSHFDWLKSVGVGGEQCLL